MTADQILLFTSMAIIAVALLVGFWFCLRIVEEVGVLLWRPSGKTYTTVISRYPDSLIFQFGFDRRLRDVRADIRIMIGPWGQPVQELLNDTKIAYANRRTASDAVRISPRITIREKALCVYKGFSICLRNDVGDRRAVTAIDYPKPADALAALKTKLERVPIYVLRGTDQHDALLELLDELGLDASQCVPVDMGQDLLETVIKADHPTGCGLVGGVTERIVAEKIGYYTVAEQPIILETREEINSFVYQKADTPQDSNDIHYAIDEMERLWSEAVTQITRNPEVREDFRNFLNEQLRENLRPETLKRLGITEICSQEDLEKLLRQWLRFPKDEK